jgi:hypothetical protein
MTKFNKIYDFSTDNKKIDFLKEFVFTKKFDKIKGQPVDGYIPGTIEWFNAINKGEIPICEISGVISKVYFTGNNWPLFEIDNNGIKTTWTREGDTKKYIANKKVILRYIKQKLINGHVDIYETILDVKISSK